MGDVRIIINAASGNGASRGGLDERARAAFPGAEVVVASPDEMDGAMERAFAARPRAVIVGGGDGTVRSAAGHVLRAADETTAPPALGLVPLGTMNLLAKDLHLPMDPAKALEVLARSVELGRVERIDAGEVSGRVFLHSSLLGILPRLGLHREKIRASRRWRDLPRRLAAASRVALTAKRLEVRLAEDGGGGEPARTWALAVANNTLRGGLPNPLTRDSLVGGELGVYRSTHETRLGLVRLLAAVGSGVWSLDRDIVARSVRSLRVESPRRELLVSNDGEIERIGTPLEYRVRARSVPVLVPPGRADEERGA